MYIISVKRSIPFRHVCCDFNKAPPANPKAFKCRVRPLNPLSLALVYEDKKESQCAANDAGKWLSLLTASASYSEGLGFHSRAEDQISWLGNTGLLLLSRFVTIQEVRAKFLPVTRMCIFQSGASVATGWRVRVWKPAKQCFFLLENVQTGPESCPTTYSVDSFLSVKRTRRHFDYFTPSTAEVKNERMCTFTPSVHLRDVERVFIYRPVGCLLAVTTNIAWALTVLNSPIHRRSNNDVTWLPATCCLPNYKQ